MPRRPRACRLARLVCALLVSSLAWAGGAAGSAAEPDPGRRGEAFVLHLVPAWAPSPGAGQGPEETADLGPVRVVAEALTPLRGEAEPPGSRTVEGAEVPGTAALPLEPGFAWALFVSSERSWSPQHVVLVEQAGGEGTLAVWPRGSLRGEIQGTGEARPEQGRPTSSASETAETSAATPASGELPATLRLRFESVPGSARGTRAGSAEVPRTEIDCPIEPEGSFSCPVPAAALDLRLSVGDLIPVYRWGVDVPPWEEADLGVLRFERGASLAGWVEVAGGTLDAENATVRVAPQTAGPARRREERQRRLRTIRESAVDRRGFFQVRGMRPGAYVVSATQPGFAVTRRGPVEVEPAGETYLRDPLVLTPPLTLEVWIDPPLDPSGEPWALQIARLGELAPGSEEVEVSADAAPDGSYALGGLSPGRYVVRVFGPGGEPLVWREVDLDRSTAPEWITVEVVEVDGTLRLGDEPLAGRVVFGGESGGVRVAMEADEEGTFRGTLPRDGGWRIDVTAEDPRVRRRLWRRIEAVDGQADVDLRLADTRIAGRVVDDRGHAVAGAVVKLLELEEAATPIWDRSADEGSFELHGVEEGLVHLDATAVDGRVSDRRVVQVSEERHVEDVELVVRERETVAGRVVSPAGPVVGARVVAMVRRGGVATPFAVTPQATSGLDGRFELELPPGTDGLDLVVHPPGYALTVRRIEPLPEEGIEVEVEEHGGTLVIHGYNPPEGPEGIPPNSFPLVLHDGIALGGGTLGNWIETSGRDSPWWRSEPLVVPAMPPGGYAVCRPDFSALFRAFALGEDPAPVLSASCVRGFLPPYGELELRAPQPPEQ